jgi:hypothetical protein
MILSRRSVVGGALAAATTHPMIGAWPATLAPDALSSGLRSILEEFPGQLREWQAAREALAGQLTPELRALANCSDLDEARKFYRHPSVLRCRIAEQALWSRIRRVLDFDIATSADCDLQEVAEDVLQMMKGGQAPDEAARRSLEILSFNRSLIRRGVSRDERYRRVIERRKALG